MKKYIENISILSIFLLFAICSLTLMILGTDQYIKISDEMEKHFEMRTPIAYMSNKVRQNDTYGGIQILKKEGKDILVLSEAEGETVYETWIYEYEGELRELYIEQGDDPELEWGMALVEINGLTMEIEKNTLRIDLLTKKDEEQEIILALRAGGIK